VYVTQLDRILLSEIFVAGASPGQLAAVILEEIDHGLDARINAIDSSGNLSVDGNVFATLTGVSSLDFTDPTQFQLI